MVFLWSFGTVMKFLKNYKKFCAAAILFFSRAHGNFRWDTPDMVMPSKTFANKGVGMNLP